MKKQINLNNKVIESITVNEKKKTVTMVSNDLEAMSFNALNRMTEEFYGIPHQEELPTKNIVMSNVVGEDQFDVNIGVALALAYTIFGSKNKFHEFVDSLPKIKEVTVKKKSTTTKAKPKTGTKPRTTNKAK